MIVYVETNFLIELALLQEEHAEAQALLDVAKGNTNVELVLPAYSLGEVHEAAERKWRERKKLHKQMRQQLEQVERSKPYAAKARMLRREATLLLVESGEEQKRRLDSVIQEVLGVARILPLDMGTLKKALVFQKSRGLSPQDSLVYASVMSDLQKVPERERGVPSCFVTTDAKHFSAEDIQNGDLGGRGCKLLSTFGAGLGFVRSQRRER